MIERTKDYELIKSIITHPEVYPYITDDYSAPSEEFEPIQDDNIIYLTTYHGLFALIPQSNVMVDLHTTILPEGRSRTISSAYEMFDWLSRNTDYRKIITHVPVDNKRAYYAAIKAGFTEEGVITKSVMRKGKLIDQYLLGRTICH